MQTISSPRVVLAIFGVILALFSASALRSQRMLGRFGLPSISRDDSSRVFWMLLAARGAAAVLLLLSAAAPDLMMDIVNGAND
jgi:hypothetical protein